MHFPSHCFPNHRFVSNLNRLQENTLFSTRRIEYFVCRCAHLSRSQNLRLVCRPSPRSTCVASRVRRTTASGASSTRTNPSTCPPLVLQTRRHRNPPGRQAMLAATQTPKSRASFCVFVHECTYIVTSHNTNVVMSILYT